MQTAARDRRKIKKLNDALKVGFDQLDRGEGILLDEAEWEKIIEESDRRIEN